jgi:hypothetical protein
MKSITTTICAVGISVCALVVSTETSAEPYIAVESGLKCSQCHTNPTGGGKRNVFGMTYARAALASRNLLQDEDTVGWNSEINQWLGVGGDYRGGYTSVDQPGPDDVSEWSTTQATVYLEVSPVPGLITLYADEQVAPGNSIDREAYLLITPKDGRYFLKAGQMFLPFGLRLQDDATFVRQASGLNFDTPDKGIELGVELPKWSAQLAVSDGTAGAGSQPGKEQTSLSAAYVLPRWRLGASVNINEDPLGDREMLGLFAGFRTGPISWLAEVDLISDELPQGGTRDVYATLIEGNWRLRKGHNLKASYEFLDPSDLTSEDEQERYRIVWEYSPFQLFQARVGFTSYNGIPRIPTSNRSEFFLETHVFF